MQKQYKVIITYLHNKIFSTEWLNQQGQLHREDGPAIEWVGGDKQWFCNGELHRTDGPAIEFADGSKQWWFNGKLHRAGSPAIERADGTKSWWLNGKSFAEQEFLQQAQSLLSYDGKVVEIDNKKYQLKEI